MTKKTKLPDKPSELIKLALRDLTACERQKARYAIDMSDWHWGTNGDRTKCFVCLAGAVMAQTLGADRAKTLDPSDFREGEKLAALNFLRCGEVATGLRQMGVERPEGMPGDRSVTHYNDDKRKFKADMRALAAELKAAGL